MIKRCEVCGAVFSAKRSTAKYCSNRCKMHARNAATVEKQKPIEAEQWRINLTQDDLLEIIERAHMLTEDMSRAAMCTPVPLCHKFGRCAKALGSALNAEGL